MQDMLAQRYFKELQEHKKNKTHHFKKRITKMEVVPNFCANKKTMHKDHAGGA